MLFSLVLLSIAVACGGDSGPNDAGTGGTGGSPPTGCIIQNFANQPDITLEVTPDNEIISFPEFEDRQAPPGSVVQVKMHVDADTRLARVTLMDAWRLRDTPQGMSDTVQQNTATGDETMTFDILIETTGRYYADVELCGTSCDEVRVVYTLNRENAGPESDAINDPYERIVYENGVEVSSSFTCDKPSSIAIQ